MDHRRNPYAPGAGVLPPELAGRGAILESAEVTLHRVRAGRYAKSQMLLGLRGVGKTVLLNRIQAMAVAEGCQTVLIESPEGEGLPTLLVPPLRQVLMRLDQGERVHEYVKLALRTLRSFASVFTATMGPVDFGVDPEPGVADSGLLEFDLPDLFIAVAEAARQKQTAIVLLVDEVQYLSARDLGALIAAVHRLNQRGLPFVLFGAGLPQVAGLAGDAKSYAERLFDYPPVTALDVDAARNALAAPAGREGAEFTDDALGHIVGQTQGYPYFLQEWGKHAWNLAAESPIDLQDAMAASERATSELDANFFRVRLDRLTPREKEYLRAMAALGAGPHRSGDIARRLGMKVQAAGSLRAGLIQKGMIYSPAHGDTAFTVPMFDAFLRRAMP